MGMNSDVHPQHWVDERTLLGNQQATFHWHYLMLVQVLALLIGFSCTVYTAAESALVLSIMCMTVAITLAIGTWLFHSRVTLYQNGLKIGSFLGSQVCLWTSISQLFDQANSSGTPTHLTITHRNGYLITVPNNVTDFHKLAQLTIHRFTEVNITDSLNVLRNGGQLFFGHINLDATHIEVNGKRLPISRIETVHLEQFGRIQLRIWTDEDKLRWLALSELPVPNRHLLKRILLTRHADLKNHPIPPDETPPPPENMEPDSDEFAFE
jgi:hypothetical protein